MQSDEIFIPNEHGSATGPYCILGGWGKPAGENDACPRCGSMKFKYEPGFAEAALNKCSDCGYDEFFMF